MMMVVMMLIMSTDMCEKIKIMLIYILCLKLILYRSVEYFKNKI